MQQFARFANNRTTASWRQEKGTYAGVQQKNSPKAFLSLYHQKAEGSSAFARNV